MTHITEARFIGNHADMGKSRPAASPTLLTVTEIVRAGVRRRARRTEVAEAQSTWDSEGKATERGTTDGQG
jgi:hypothetical protein